MNRENIIKMAREIDPVTALLLDKKAPQGMEHETFVWFLERFAALVRADEREQCAKVCDAIDEDIRLHEDVAACAFTIRARSNT